MGKRYVFWRKPTGEAHKKDDGRFAPTALLAKIGESATVNADGSISWPFPDLHENERAVRSAMVVLDPDGNELNETNTWSISSEASKAVIQKQGGGKPILATDFVKSADKAAATFFRKPAVDYVLLTSLSIESLPTKQISIRGCQVSSITDRRKYSYPDALKNRIHETAFAGHLKSTKYLTIRVRTSGRSVFEATDKALDALNLLRGLWTVFSTYGQFTMRMGSTEQEPIGVIHTGPIHTLHYVDGSPAVDLFWYEPGYSGDKKLFKPRNGWKKLDEHRRMAIRRMRSCPFGAETELLVMRYAEALDQTNLDVAFVQMWSILEKATNTIGANYDETIQRATWVFKDQKNAKEKLEYLRTRRNQYIHAARSSSDQDQVAYLAKSFVDPHLVRLVFNEFDVASIAEYGKFLALPTDISTLEKRRDQIKQAIKIRKPRKSS